MWAAHWAAQHCSFLLYSRLRIFGFVCLCMFVILGRGTQGIKDTSTWFTTSSMYTISYISTTKCVIICQWRQTMRSTGRYNCIAKNCFVRGRLFDWVGRSVMSSTITSNVQWGKCWGKPESVFPLNPLPSLADCVRNVMGFQKRPTWLQIPYYSISILISHLSNLIYSGLFIIAVFAGSVSALLSFWKMWTKYISNECSKWVIAHLNISDWFTWSHLSKVENGNKKYKHASKTCLHLQFLLWFFGMPCLFLNPDWCERVE